MSRYLIQAQELYEQLSQPGYLVFDVRHDLHDASVGRQLYESGHIPGALFLDHATQLSAPQTGFNGRHPLVKRNEFAALMRSQGLTARSKVVIYDGGQSMYASHMWWMLRWLGHDRVMVLDGGLPAWVAAGGTLEQGSRSASLSEAQAVQGAPLSTEASTPMIDAAQLMENLHKPEMMLLDARKQERYSGAVEPLDPVAGHIPGALNRPFTENLRTDGRFKSAGRLKDEFEELLQGRLPDQVVHYCGSGISACHNLFAMELAGLHGSALYPGSWSEWCSDPARPVEAQHASDA